MIYNSTFIWFFGVVEDRNDPALAGRVKVRVIGLHSEKKTDIPTEDLHWAQVVMPSTSASISGVGETNGLVEGSYVIGFFIDGKNLQSPMILGSVQGVPVNPANPNEGFYDPRTGEGLRASEVPGEVKSVKYKSDGSPIEVIETDPRPNHPKLPDEPDTNRLARAESQQETQYYKNKTASREAGQIDIPPAAYNEITTPMVLPKTGAPGTPLTLTPIPVATYQEPEVPYAAKYPYNKVQESESGHMTEIDDTPGAERIHTYHRTGSFKEYHPNGDVVHKTVGDDYSHHQKDSYEHVDGTKKIVIDKGMKLHVNSDATDNGLDIEVGESGDFNIIVKSGNVNMFVTGDVNKHIIGNLNEHITGNVQRQIDGRLSEVIMLGHDVYIDTGGHIENIKAGGKIENIKAGGKIETITAGGKIETIIAGGRVETIGAGGKLETITGTVSTTSTGNHTIVAPIIDLNP